MKLIRAVQTDTTGMRFTILEATTGARMSCLSRADICSTGSVRVGCGLLQHHGGRGHRFRSKATNRHGRYPDRLLHRHFHERLPGFYRQGLCELPMLKRLDKAIRDGDTVRAVIRGSGVNQDGWTQGVTMPSGDAQAALINFVYKSNGLDYGATQYVEAHGTGTQAGDPTEAGAIYRTIGQGGQKKL